MRVMISVNVNEVRKCDVSRMFYEKLHNLFAGLNRHFPPGSPLLRKKLKTA